jgi:tellurite resistance protein TehA-like permease
MTLSITAIGQVLDSTPVQVVGLIGAVILLIVWVLVAVRTIRLVAAARTR